MATLPQIEDVESSPSPDKRGSRSDKRVVPYKLPGYRRGYTAMSNAGKHPPRHIPLLVAEWIKVNGNWHTLKHGLNMADEEICLDVEGFLKKGHLPCKVDWYDNTATVTTPDKGTWKLSLPRWVYLTYSWMHKDMGKLQFIQGPRRDNGERLPIACIRKYTREKSKLKSVTSWVISSLYPDCSSGRYSLVDGDGRNLTDENIIPKTPGSLFPGTVLEPDWLGDNKERWRYYDEEGSMYESHDELDVYRQLAEDGRDVKPCNEHKKRSPYGRWNFPAAEYLEDLRHRAVMLDYQHGTDRGVHGWFTQSGRGENGLCTINSWKTWKDEQQEAGHL